MKTLQLWRAGQSRSLNFNATLSLYCFTAKDYQNVKCFGLCLTVSSLFDGIDCNQSDYRFKP